MDHSQASPASSSQPTACHMQGSAAGAGDNRNRNLPCLHIGCNAMCPDEQSLDQHMKIHFPIYHYPYPYPYDTNAGDTVTLPCASSFHPVSPVAPGYGHQSAPSFQHASITPLATTRHQPNHASTTAAPIQNTAYASGYVGNRFTCVSAGCTQTFSREADLNRHVKSHRAGVKDFDCPVRGCRRKGVYGFMRKDKLKDHLKAAHKW